MWWQAVFWLLLLPLIIAEIIIFVKTKRFFWLIYALAIFAYVVAVSYTIDVFDLGRNGVILTLLASAVLMAATGWYLGKGVPKRKDLPKKALWGSIGLLAAMLIIFVVSVIFGRLDETLSPVGSVQGDQLLTVFNDEGPLRPESSSTVVLLQRTLRNDFILPVPAPSRSYSACIRTAEGFIQQPLIQHSVYPLEAQEVPGRETVTLDVRFSRVSVSEREMAQPVEVLVYSWEDGQRTYEYSYMSCADIVAEPVFRIPVE